MAKSGTGWLYDQLSHHPDFWMPPAKELHYLDRDVPQLINSQQILKNWDKAGRLAQRRGRTWGERERSFLTDAVACAGKPRDIERYANLFRHKDDLLSGDISPGYCALDDETIGEIAFGLPDTKIILLVREPISRVWSRLCMAERVGQFDASLLEDPNKFSEFIGRPRYVEPSSFPTRIIRQWSLHFPLNKRFRVFLFDDIAQRPAETLRDILDFLGADPSKGGTLPADFNRKSRYQKREMPDHIRRLLIEQLGEEVRACSELLGGAARAWPSSLA